MTTTLDAPAPLASHRSGRRRRFEPAVPWLLATVALAAHLPFVARYPTEWDSVSLVFGVDRFDVAQASPHAPGYWVYVAAGRLVRALTPLDAHHSLVAASALAASATVALAYVLGRELAGRWLGLAAAAVLLTSPFLLFYGASAASYAFDALAAVVLALLAWRARPGSAHGVAAAVALGLAGGARQSSLVLLAPLAAVALARSVRSVPAALRAAAAGAASVAAWLVPMAAEQPGGLAVVAREGGRIWRSAVTVTSPLYGAPAPGVGANVGQAAGYTLAAVAFLLPATAAALVVHALSRRRGGVPAGAKGLRARSLTGPRLLAVAALPPFAFVVVFHFGKAGYVLSYLPALVLLALWPVARLAPRPRLVLSAVVALACVVQAARFAGSPGILPVRMTDAGGPWFTRSRFGAPYRLTARAIRDVDRDTEGYLAIRRAFDPRTDVLVYVYLDGGHRYRHAMSTLPEFTAHYLQNGRDDYVGRHRRWRFEHDREVELPPGGRAVFVLDELRPDLLALVDRGVASAVLLDTGPAVYVVPLGQDLFGVRLVASARPPP